VKETLKSLAGTPYAPSPAQILKGGWVHPNKRIFNNAKVSDHFAIIPTGTEPKNLSEAGTEALRPGHQALSRHFLPGGRIQHHDAHHPRRGRGLQDRGQGAGERPAGSRSTARSAGNPTKTNAQPGAGQAEGARLGQRCRGQGEGQTKPPARFTEATLLTAMEGAGKLIEDEELREAMSERGLGTPATRAATIEGLIRRIRAPQRPRAAADGQGLLADGRPVNARHRRTAFARTDRRTGNTS
jgi:DNA topoisomerase-3